MLSRSIQLKGRGESVPLALGMDAASGLRRRRGQLVEPLKLADMGPVLLLYVGIVVLLVGSAAGKLDTRLIAESLGMVDEDALVIGIDPFEGKG